MISLSAFRNWATLLTDTLWYRQISDPDRVMSLREKRVRQMMSYVTDPHRDTDAVVQRLECIEKDKNWNLDVSNAIISGSKRKVSQVVYSMRELLSSKTQWKYWLVFNQCKSLIFPLELPLLHSKILPLSLPRIKQ